MKGCSGEFRVKTCVIQSESLKTVTLLAIAAGVIASCEAKIIQKGAPNDLMPTYTARGSGIYLQRATLTQ